MTMRIFVPRDAGAVAVGADEVAHGAGAGCRQARHRRRDRQDRIARALLAGADGRGRDTAGPRRVRPGDRRPTCHSVLDAMTIGGAHPLRLGLADEIPWLKRQTRLTFARCGVIDPRSVGDYRAHDGYKGLERALTLTSDAILADVTASGLRGRGGAGFPTGIKWKTVAQTSADRKYIVCNADEGDSGTFADRMIMEGDPFVRDRGHDDRRHRGRRHQGLHLHPLGISARGGGDERRDRGGAARRLSRRAHRRLQPQLRSRSPRRRRRLCLRRGNLAAGKPRRPPRHRPRQAAAARAQGPVRQAHRDQQRAVIRGDPLHPRRRRQGLCRFRHGPLARHDADPARRQHQAWRPVRGRVRHHARRTRSTISAAAPAAAARCARCRSAARSAPTSRARCSTRRSTTRPSPRATA